MKNNLRFRYQKKKNSFSKLSYRIYSNAATIQEHLSE